jgi:hypothetical protein
MNLVKKILIAIVLSIFSINFVNAQSTATGSLSINPSSFSLTSQGATTSLSVVYTGSDMQGAEVYLTLGSGLKINSFTAGTGLTKLYESTTTNEFHVGSLDTITSGQTLFTFVVEATSCSQSGQVGFNSTNTNVPNVTLTFNNSTYQIDCTGGTTTTPTPIITTGTTQTPTTIPYTPTTLPVTGLSNEPVLTILSSIALLISGIIAGVFFIKIRSIKREEEIKLIVIS